MYIEFLIKNISKNAFKLMIVIGQQLFFCVILDICTILKKNVNKFYKQKINAIF